MSLLVSPVFVGRRRELDVLMGALERARAGEPAVVIVGGEAGVGKTRLVEEAAARAGVADARVLMGSCVELGGEGLPFAPLVDALRELARTTGPEELEAFLGPARRELARLLPELDPAASAAPSDGGSAASRLFELVLGVIGRLAAERSLLLVIEDLHWADRSTLDLVAFLVRTLRAAPVLVVATYRSDELHRRHPLRPVLASLERVRAVQRIDLPRLARGDVAAQLEAILGAPVEPVLLDRVYDRSEGNAFLVEEMLGIVQAGADPDHLPPSLRDVLLARAEQLPDRVQQMLRVVAVAGRHVPDGLLAAVAGFPRTELRDALRDAVEHHLLVVDEAGYAFRHALVRDAVYDDMLPAERVELHAAYGDAIERDPALAGDEGSATAALAHHWFAAHDLPRALAAAIQAARHATAAYAPADAERHLERALAIWPQVADPEERAGLDRLALVERALDAALLAGDDDRALTLVDEALAQVDHERQPARSALLLERRAEALRRAGQGYGLAELEEAVGLLPRDPATPELAVVLASLANTRLLEGDMAHAREVAHRAVAAARAFDDRRQEANALLTLGTAVAYLGELDEGLDALRRGANLAEQLGDHEVALRAAINISDVLELAGRHEEAAELAAERLGLAQRVGLGRKYGSFLMYNHLEPLVSLGRWAEADRLAAEAAELDPMATRTIPLHHFRAMIAIGSGRFQDADKHVALARQIAGGDIDFQQTALSAVIEAQLHHARGDLSAARAMVERALADDATRTVPSLAWPLVWLGLQVEADAATLARDRRRPPDADTEARAEELNRIAAELPRPTPPMQGYAALAAAERTRIAGEPAPAAWETAVSAGRAAGKPHPLAYALLRLGEANLAAGEKPAAAEAVREAAEIARRLGAEPLVADAEALARRGRLKPARASAADEADRFGLTDREREVLRLVAEGRSNSQIADELFISPKTASVHVSNIMSKLGVSGRVEAAAVAHRLALTGSRDDEQ